MRQRPRVYAQEGLEHVEAGRSRIERLRRRQVSADRIGRANIRSRVGATSSQEVGTERARGPGVEAEKVTFDDAASAADNSNIGMEFGSLMGGILLGTRMSITRMPVCGPGLAWK